MKSLKTIFQFLIISFVIISCESESLNNGEMNTFREVFVKNLDGTEEKAAFANLSNEQKKGKYPRVFIFLFEITNFLSDEAKNLCIASLRNDFLTKYDRKFVFHNCINKYSRVLIWKSKIEHIISTDISNKQQELLLKIIHKLDNHTSSKDLRYSEEFRELILEFANTTDYENFTNMFLTLNSFSSYNIVYKNGLGRAYLVKKIKSDFDQAKKYRVEGNQDTEKVGCNCSWTCDGDSPFYTEDCKTGGNCGFLFLFNCIGYH